MRLRMYTVLILVTFVFSGVFGLYVNFGTVHHMAGCPSALGETSVCSGSLDHLKHWESAFASIVAAAIAFLGSVIVAFFIAKSGGETRARSRYRRMIVRPTLLQELAASGILNPKAP